MTVQDAQGDNPADDEARLLDAEQQHEAADAAAATETDGEGEEAAEARRSRPGKLERRLQRTEAQLQAERAAAAEARRRATELERRLAEANEAGNRLVARNIAGEIASAQAELRDAIVGNDADAVVKAQSRVSELISASAQLRQAQRDAPAPQQQAAPSYTPSTSAWMAANPWFGSDAGLTGLAKAVHAQAERQGIKVDTPEYWKFIEKGVEAVAPGTVRRVGAAAAADADEDDDPPAPAARPGAGAPVSRSSARAPTSRAPDLRLTPAEADAAKVSGMSAQEFKHWQAKLRANGRITAGAR